MNQLINIFNDFPSIMWKVTVYMILGIFIFPLLLFIHIFNLFTLK